MKANASESRVMASPLVTVASLVVILAGLKSAEAIVVPFFLALFIAIICTGPLHILERAGIPHSISLLIVLVVLTTIGVLLLTVAGTALVDFTNQIPAYRAQLRDFLKSMFATLQAQGWKIPEERIESMVDPNSLFGLVGSLFAALGQTLNNFIVLIVIVAFMLLEAFSFSEKIRGGLQDPETALNQIHRIVLTVKQFLVIKTVVSLLLAGCVVVLLHFCGMRDVILWALLAFLLNYIPIFGALLAAIPPILIQLVGRGWQWAVVLAIGYIVITTVLFNIVEPALMGRRLGLSPLAVILSILFWGWLFGPVGMLLAVPIMMAIKISFECHREGHWLPALLDSQPHVDQVADRAKPAVVPQ